MLIESEFTPHKATKLAIEALTDQADTVIPVLLPLELMKQKDGESVTLPQLLEAVVAEKTFRAAADKLGLRVSTVRQMTKAWLLYLQERQLLPARPAVTVSETWEKWLIQRVIEYHNYEQMVAFVGSEAFRQEAEILSGIRVSRSQPEDGVGKYSILDLLFFANGWGVDTLDSVALGNMIGRSDKFISSQVNAAMQLLNELYGLEMKVTLSQEAERFLEGMLIQYDRLVLTHDYLKKNKDTLLPVEQQVLELYLLGYTQEEIIAHLQAMQEQAPDEVLVATPSSTARFLQKVHQMSAGTSPFARVALAARAAEIMDKEQHLEPFTRQVLEGVKSGLSFVEIAERLSVEVREVRKITSSFDLKMPSREENRRTVLRERTTLLAQVQALPDWEGKAAQLKVLVALVTPHDTAHTDQALPERDAAESVPTYADVARKYNLSEDQVSFIVARLRAMVKRSGRSISRSRQFG